MKQFRVTQIQVLGAGAVVIVGIALLFLFMFILPMSKKIARTNSDAEGIEATNRTGRPKAEKDLAAAKLAEIEITKKYDEIFEKRMPKVDLSDPITGMFTLAYDVPRREGLLIDRWFTSTGAQISGYSFPSFATQLPDPNMRSLPELNWNLSVTVRSLPQFLQWLEKIPKAPRLLVLTGVSLPGMRQPGTPFAGSVQVRLYELLKPSEAAVAAAAAAAAEQAAGAATSPGGGPAGGPGGGRGGRGGRGMGGMRGGMRGG